MFVREQDDAKRPVHTRVGRVIVITSLIAIGAIAVATRGWLSPDGDRRSAASTAAEPATTEAAVAVEVGPTGYIAGRLPDGFVGSGAYNTPADAFIDTGSWMEVWATPDASRISGRWLATSTSIYDYSPLVPLSDGITRVLVGDHYALRRVDADGITVVTMTTDDQRIGTIATHGFTDDEVAEIVDNLSIDDATARPRFRRPIDVIDGLDLVVSQATDQSGFYGATISSQRDAYYRSADSSTGFSVRSGPQRSNDLFVNRLLSQPATDPAAAVLAPDRVVDLGGHDAIVGSTGTEPYVSQFVMWHDGTSTVMVTGDPGMPLIQLLDIAGTVRPSSADEWLAQLNSHPDDGNSSGVDWSSADDYTTVGTTTTASQTTWTFGLAVTAASKPPSAGMIWAQVETARPPDDTLFSGTTSFGFPITTDQPQPVSVYVSIDATIVFATVDTANAPSSAVGLRVRLPGLEPVEIPLVPVPNSTISGAAYAFSQVGEYSAELVDANGDVITPTRPS